MPMPMPSMAESTTVFLQANISARPRMMQLTTISGMNTPIASYRLWVKACITIWTMVTKLAMMTM